MERSFSALRIKNTGFTLVEILVVLAIAGIITAGIFNFMISQSRSYNVQEEVQEMQQNARAAMDYLTAELQKTKEITIGGGGYTITLLYDTDGDGDLESPAYNFNLSGDFNSNTPLYDYSNEELNSARISTSGGGGFLAAFITQDLNETGNPDTPLFEYNPAVNSKMVTLTIIARTRNRDPNYVPNNGYRQIVLRRRVVLINS